MWPQTRPNQTDRNARVPAGSPEWADPATESAAFSMVPVAVESCDKTFRVREDVSYGGVTSCRGRMRDKGRW